MIGVADSTLKNFGINSDTINAIVYHGAYTKVLGEGKDEAIWKGGKILKTGDTVSVIVDLEKAEI